MELPIVSICLLLACLTPASHQQDDCQNKDTRCPDMPKHGREVFCQRPWARRNCEQLCGICGDEPLVVKVSCYDINNRCADMPHDYDVFCARPWAKRNCKKFCRVCVSDNAETSSTSTPLTTTKSTTSAHTTTTTEVTTTTTPTTTTTIPTTTTTTPPTTTTTTTTTTTPPTTTTTTTTTTTPPTTTTLATTTRAPRLCERHEGVVKIYGVRMLCEGGWLVFQQRKNGQLNFKRTMTEYRKGFSDERLQYNNADFWLGLDYIHRLCGTVEDKCELQVESDPPSSKVHVQKYNTFYINSEEDKFRLNIGHYEGHKGFHYFLGFNQNQFSNTFTDAEKSDCRKVNFQRESGWWFSACRLYSGWNDVEFKGVQTKLKLRRLAPFTDDVFQ